ncbi:MAG: hypothetical protein ACREJR_09435 [Candidatus Rokuibacteriota bacterium]
MKRLKRARPSPALIVAVVALVAALAGTAVASDPLATSSAKKVTKKKVKKIADRRINKLAPGLSVDNADRLGDRPANDYELKEETLFATVAPANANPAIVRGRGATAVIRQAVGSFRVTFDRDVTGCTWLATYGQPNDANVDARWATVRGRDNPNQVGVVLRDQAGTQLDGQGFHVAVLCPGE